MKWGSVSFDVDAVVSDWLTIAPKESGLLNLQSRCQSPLRQLRIPAVMVVNRRIFGLQVVADNRDDGSTVASCRAHCRQVYPYEHMAELIGRFNHTELNGSRRPNLSSV